MTKKLILPLVLALAMSALPSCNSSTDDVEYTYSSSVLVSAFSLTNDSKVLDSLQNVFFSINLEKAQIFNADSLPYGTDVSHLIPVITTESSVSAVSLSFPRENQTDSVVNYLTNSTDSIDFSLGPVKLSVTSQSGLVNRTYEIRVNVHQTKPDTLIWNQIQSAELPTSFTTITAQRTAELNGTYYCLSANGTEYCLATTTNPADPEWDIQAVTFPFEPNVKSLRQSDNALYILDTFGALYKSIDCQTWTVTSEVWHNIYGGYGDEIIGSSQQDGTWRVCFYPSGQTYAMPTGFPIEGTSVPNCYTLPMGLHPMLVMVGGIDADGNLLSSSWSFDGENWADISRAPIPLALEQMNVVEYDLFSVTSSTWAPVQYPALVAMGGRATKGINRTVYLSKDWGMTWSEAPELMQLSSEVPVSYGSSAFVHSTTMHLSRSGQSDAGWVSLPVRKLYPHCTLLTPTSHPSRVTEAVTEWECPAIYMFGGYDYDGQAYNTLWRGVILRYTFDPVY